MARKVWMLNMLILLLLLLAGYHTYRLWSIKSTDYTQDFPNPAPAKALPESLAVLSAPRPREGYQSIIDNNIFSQTRSPEAPSVPEAPVKKVAASDTDAKDRYVLYGTVSINRENYYALIKDKKSAEAKTRSFKVGDRLPGNEIITSIDKKRILVTSSSGKTEIRLRSPKGPEDISFVPAPVPASRSQPPQKTIRRAPVPADRSSSRILRPRRQIPQPSQIGEMQEENPPGYPQEDDEIYQEEEPEEYPPGYEEIPDDGGQP